MDRCRMYLDEIGILLDRIWHQIKRYINKKGFKMANISAEKTSFLKQQEFSYYLGGMDEDEFETSRLEGKIEQSLVENERPGSIKIHGKITLHTRNAHSMFYGRKGGVRVYPIMGLVQFASKINQIYSAAKQDDPYADYQLIKIEKKIESSRKLIEEHTKSLVDLLNASDGMKVDPGFSVSPIDVDLKFRVTYSYLTAQLVVMYDKLCQNAIAATHVGLMSSAEWKLIVRPCAKSIRSIIYSASGYTASGVVRGDFAEGGDKIDAAILLNGRLPEEVLDGSQRASHAPVINKNPRANRMTHTS